MKFDLNQGSKGEWFPYFGSTVRADGTVDYAEPQPGAARVCLRIADAETLEKIHAQTRAKKAEFVLNPQTRQMERVVYYDQAPDQAKKERELIWDHAIVDWEGIEDADSKPIPCTAENKMRLINIPEFARYIGRCLQIMGTAEADQAEASEKN